MIHENKIKKIPDLFTFNNSCICLLVQLVFLLKSVTTWDGPYASICCGDWKSKSNTNMPATVSISAFEGQVYVLFVSELFRMNWTSASYSRIIFSTCPNGSPCPRKWQHSDQPFWTKTLKEQCLVQVLDEAGEVGISCSASECRLERESAQSCSSSTSVSSSDSWVTGVLIKQCICSMQMRGFQKSWKGISFFLSLKSASCQKSLNISDCSEGSTKFVNFSQNTGFCPGQVLFTLFLLLSQFRSVLSFKCITNNNNT